jgi:hypothetical protein
VGVILSQPFSGENLAPNIAVTKTFKVFEGNNRTTVAAFVNGATNSMRGRLPLEASAGLRAQFLVADKIAGNRNASLSVSATAAQIVGIDREKPGVSSTGRGGGAGQLGVELTLNRTTFTADASQTLNYGSGKTATALRVGIDQQIGRDFSVGVTATKAIIPEHRDSNEVALYASYGGNRHPKTIDAAAVVDEAVKEISPGPTEPPPVPATPAVRGLW